MPIKKELMQIAAHTLEVMAMRQRLRVIKRLGVQRSAIFPLVSLYYLTNLMFTTIVDIRICWKISVKKLTRNSYLVLRSMPWVENLN